MLTNQQLSLMGTATNLLRCQGEQAFMAFFEANSALIKVRHDAHLANPTTYKISSKEDREKVLFEYAIGEVYLEQLPPEAQEGVRHTAAMMHRKLRGWFRYGFVAGCIATGLTVAAIAHFRNPAGAALNPEQIRLECAQYASEHQAAYQRWETTYQAQIDDFVGPVNAKYSATLRTPNPKAFCESFRG
jgi:hypothetical protein